MKKDILRQVVVVVAAMAMIVINALANALPLNNQTTGEISDRFPVYFVPAGYVFSIWGLIYLGMIAFAVYQALPAQRENKRLRRIGGLFLLASLANIAWLFLWHYEHFPLTLLAMFVLLICLILLYLRLNVGREKVSPFEKWFVHVPFSIYLAWITVATIANVTSVLYDIHWSGWGILDQAWAVIMIFAATVIAIAVHLTRNDVAYMMVILWALAGIAVKHMETPWVSTAAWIASGLVVVATIFGIFIVTRRRESPLTIE
jgi:hypothetical protein